MRKSPGQIMLEVLVRLLKNKDRFTATEIGLMAAVTVIAIERVLVKFRPSVGGNLNPDRVCLEPRSAGPEQGIATVPVRYFFGVL